MKHSIVYAEQGIYAGWPANHGAWQWGDEFLVGFLRGKYKSKSMHNIAEPFQKVHARSMDGGETWCLEVPNVDFECIQPTAPPLFSLQDGVIMRVCGVYDHGGDVCNETGGFYSSGDRGKSWSGPYKFDGLEKEFGGESICTARTRVHDNLIFLSHGQRNIWGTDSVFCATTHNGFNFKFKSIVCDDNARAVMPAVAGIGDKIVVAMRRRKTAVREGWIDAVSSSDGGVSWTKPVRVGTTGSRNGNPPALIALPDGRLVCCFGNRDEGGMVYAVSEDGVKWDSHAFRVGSEDQKDIGYPQLFLRSDGIPICVYYWADDANPHQHIAATVLEAI